MLKCASSTVKVLEEMLKHILHDVPKMCLMLQAFLKVLVLVLKYWGECLTPCLVLFASNDITGYHIIHQHCHCIHRIN